jgi:predicted RNase H-like nuclease (RuvC/YqgF family)
MGLKSDMEGYERKFKSYETELDRERSFTNEFAFKIIALSSEIERLNAEGGLMSKQKSKEYQELQEHYSRLQSKVQSKNNEIDMLVAKISSLESK